ncbi:hypothetical protein DWV00_19165 [Trinickia dinghuensis]|uniref:Uncharacterized protein n=2 Tax=Trinickia dinghuensis TaxID=2291023 RepID=A0A3D8JWU9_9BURK|nr:hypothetical protein DWV00_19165 [Trinickia dinghuensis]
MADPSQGDAYWCFDVGAADASGLILRAAKGLPLPLKTCSITDRQIVVIPGGNQKIASDMFIEAYLRRTIASSQARSTADPPSKKLTRFYLRATCDPSTVVVAQVGVQPPQYLAASYSCFDF